MSDNDTTADKSIVEELNFGTKTSKRATWEAFEFSIEAPHLVRVTNASYGVEKDEHSYLVGVEDREGLLTPAECECPADQYNEEYDCKHKVALGTIGGPVVLEASVEFQTESVDTDHSNTSTLSEKLRADGGESNRLNAEKREECLNGSEMCPGPNGDSLPCFPCYQSSEEQ
ncbi:hypothetical protein GCM10008995_01530 [Halobellus salinus]|uniref:SWIM-type domain-containing protein n=1 Tax=Halobellus salinus TaxID=931585 RepID=A0A830ELH8_9EURY|nr:SWIM zinc finger family protein [Halobellus salinus]GGI95013.1 hypothetical protein GCM10008995_01530 [Halobellus salinus]SMP20480.1 SWIM zinc finger [Halobellus salinus]